MNTDTMEGTESTALRSFVTVRDALGSHAGVLIERYEQRCGVSLVGCFQLILRFHPQRVALVRATRVSARPLIMGTCVTGLVLVIWFAYLGFSVRGPIVANLALIVLEWFVCLVIRWRARHVLYRLQTEECRVATLVTYMNGMLGILKEREGDTENIVVSALTDMAQRVERECLSKEVLSGMVYTASFFGFVDINPNHLLLAVRGNPAGIPVSASG